MEKEPEKIIELVHVKKTYHMGKEKIHAVDDVSFTIHKGEFCCLLGTSGSGKSTLLNLMAGIEKISSGKIIIKGKNIPKLNENQLAKFRQKNLGFVFQSYNLIGSMTAQENVEFPLVFKRVRAKKRKRMAKDILVKVGLGSRLLHKPKEMSGGQQQRVGIARAFVAKPEIVFADEPTGNLDTRTTIEVMELIKQMARDNNQTIVMVTHDRSLAAYADKVIHILDGKIQSIEVTKKGDQEDMQARLNDISRQILMERGSDGGTSETNPDAEGANRASLNAERPDGTNPDAEGPDGANLDAEGANGASLNAERPDGTNLDAEEPDKAAGKGTFQEEAAIADAGEPEASWENTAGQTEAMETVLPEDREHRDAAFRLRSRRRKE